MVEAEMPEDSVGPAPSPHSHEWVVGELLCNGGWHCGLPDAVLLLQEKWVPLMRKLLKLTLQKAS